MVVSVVHMIEPYNKNKPSHVIIVVLHKSPITIGFASESTGSSQKKNQTVPRAASQSYCTVHCTRDWTRRLGASVALTILALDEKVDQQR
jgi:hypothetical protein